MRRLLLFLLAAFSVGCKGPNAPEAFRLGFFPNLTHGQALVGNEEGTFARALGQTALKVVKFNAGPAAMEALMAGELDATYVGSGPALIAFVRSEGSVRIIAGSASGGAFMVSHGAKRAEELIGKRVAAPQIGNSQDISLRYWLLTQGLRPKDLGGTVDVIPKSNADILALFRQRQIEAAWVPEPWASQLLSAGGQVMVDERTLWPKGQYPTTVLLVSKRALEKKPEQVKAILKAHLALTARARAYPEKWAMEVQGAFAKLTGKKLSDGLVKGALSRLEFLTDPLPEQLQQMADHAAALGYIPAVKTYELVDLTLLQELEVDRRARPRPVGRH